MVAVSLSAVGQRMRLPAGDYHWNKVKGFVDDPPQSDYEHASEAAREAFRDMKYGIRIHWGVYTLHEVEASWPFLDMSDAERAECQELYRKFNPDAFDAEEWMGPPVSTGVYARRREPKTNLAQEELKSRLRCRPCETFPTALATAASWRAAKIQHPESAASPIRVCTCAPNR